MAADAVPRREEECGACCIRSRFLRRFSDVRVFVGLMCAVIGVQGAYLGYIVGVLTNLEKRFELSSSRSGFLLSMYDIGHTATVLFVGHFLAYRHKPRWTAAGVLLSAVSMFALTLPNWVFGATIVEGGEDEWRSHHSLECDPARIYTSDWSSKGQKGVTAGCESSKAHEGAYAILCLAQLLAGVAAAPFNTVAYIYIDDNVNPRQSPFYLGLLTSMYAFGPAFGFALSSWCNSMHVNMKAPAGLDASSPIWIGAWWLGFIACGIAYLFLAAPVFCFPFRLRTKNSHQENVEMASMMPDEQHQRNGDVAGSQTGLGTGPACRSILDTVKELPHATWHLLKNPVYTSMVVGWIFGSYLVGGYATYLPKYIETQYFQSAWKADLYAGLISIGSVAVSTACGGYLLTKFNISPRRSLMYLMITWSVIAVTYLLGMISGCVQPALHGHPIGNGRWNFTNRCNALCHCNSITEFDPVCDGSNTYFSPCHAGCTYDYEKKVWDLCRCTDPIPYQNVIRGFCVGECNALSIYLSIMFIGFFIGNLFFMTTMMVVLRCVQEEERSLALSLASLLTNIAGFIPSPVIFGHIIDTSCIVWHSLCPDSGNCIVYDNESFRIKYHVGNAAFQSAAIVATLVTWLFSRKRPFPEELADADDQTVQGEDGDNR